MRFQVETPTGLVRLAVEEISFTDPQTGRETTRFRAKTPGLNCGGKTEVAAYDLAMAEIFRRRWNDRPR